MKLQSIELDKFKCFDRLKVKCAKFTLLTGANSSGKSSIMMSLLGALQTKRFPFHFSPNGSYVNMGDFVELAHDHDPAAEVRVALTLAGGSTEKSIVLDSTFIQDTDTKLPRLKNLIYKSPDLEFKATPQGSGYKANYRYDPLKDPMREIGDSPKFVAFMDNLVGFLSDASKKTKAKANSKSKPSAKTAEESIRQMKEAFRTESTSGEYTFKNASEFFSAGDNAFLTRRITEMCTHTEDFNRRSNYISSFRLPPERTYYQRTRSAMKVEKFGENWIDQVVEWEQSNAPEYQTLQKLSKRLGLANVIKARHHGGGRYEMRVSPYDQAIDCALNDVGFGVSQFLPLLVADLQLGKGSTFMVSQPEIHLHPKIQADYVSLLVDTSAKQDKAYVIETHSEYMLNRFRLLIAKGDISPDDVSVYYLTRGKRGMRCCNLRFEKDGSITNAPSDFFETYMMDTVEIALHAKA